MRGGPALEGLEPTVSYVREIMLKNANPEATSAALEFSPKHLKILQKQSIETTKKKKHSAEIS